MTRTVAEAAEAIRSGDATPLDLVTAALERIDERDGDINAFLHVDRDGAMSAARELTDELSGDGPRGPLHGIPIAVKDLLDVAGMPTTAASPLLNETPSADATVVAKLRAAGAVVVGKTNLDEFAYGVFSPPTRNPWDLDRVPGGSSGGSAAAVAAGMCLGALGTDTAGSIRIPASFCGVAGLKPRNGRVATNGIVPLAPSLDSCGPIARTVEDVALMWSAIVGADGSGTAAGADTSKVAVVDADSIPDLHVSVGDIYAEVTEAVSEGFDVSSVKLPRFQRWERARGWLLMTEALQVHRERGWFPDERDGYAGPLGSDLEYAARLDPSAVVEEIESLTQLRTEVDELLDGVAALVLPTSPVPPPRISDMDDRDRRRTVVGAITRLVGPLNACMVAAVTVPWGIAEGLPVGIDVVARDEVTALSVARRIDELAPGVTVSA